MNVIAPTGFAEGDEDLMQASFPGSQEAHAAPAETDRMMAAIEAQMQGQGPRENDPEITAVVAHEREGLEPIVDSLDEPAPQEAPHELGFPQMEDDGTSGLGAS